jgi:hypothetical protein
MNRYHELFLASFTAHHHELWGIIFGLDMNKHA